MPTAIRIIDRIQDMGDFQGPLVNGGVVGYSNGSFSLALGSGADAYREFDLSPPNIVFTIIHNMGKRPSVRVVDTAGTEMECSIQDVPGNELNALTIRMNSASSGKVFLN